MSSKSKDKGDCFFCKCTHKSNKLYAERLAWFLGKDFSDSEAANQARNELLTLSKMDPKIYMTTSPVTRALLKSAEQTIEDDEPMGSVPQVTPAQFDRILEVGAQTSTVVENAQGGRKADLGKPRYELVPQRALAEVVKVLTHGAAKYGDFNYLKVEEHRYHGAIGRHLAQAVGVSLDGSEPSETDVDSGLLHLAHVACNALILLEQRLRQDDEYDKDLLELKTHDGAKVAFDGVEVFSSRDGEPLFRVVGTEEVDGDKFTWVSFKMPEEEK